MLVPSGQFRIFCWASPLDMRCGMDRIAYLVKTEFAMNPHGGAVFLFFNRNRTRAKIYFYDGTGSCLFMKRLEKGRFKIPKIDPNSKVLTIAASELALLLEGVDTQRLVRPQKPWRPKKELEGESDHLN